MFRIPPNPLIDRYAARGAHQAIRRGLIISGVGGMLGIISCFGDYSVGFCFMPWFIAAPPTLAILSAIVTGRHLIGEQYKLLLLTPLSRSEMLKSFLFICFYRLSAIWVSTVVFVGFMTGGLASLIIDLGVYVDGLWRSGPGNGVWNVAIMLPLMLGIAVGLLGGTIGLPVVCGMTLVLWWRKTIEAAIVSAVTVITVMIVMALPVILIQRLSPERGYYGLMLLATVITAILPFAITWGLLRIAQRQVSVASHE